MMNIALNMNMRLSKMAKLYSVEVSIYQTTPWHNGVLDSSDDIPDVELPEALDFLGFSSTVNTLDGSDDGSDHGKCSKDDDKSAETKAIETVEIYAIETTDLTAAIYEASLVKSVPQKVSRE